MASSTRRKSGRAAHEWSSNEEKQQQQQQQLKMESGGGGTVADLSAGGAQVQPSVAEVGPADRSPVQVGGKRLAVRPTSLYGVARAAVARADPSSNSLYQQQQQQQNNNSSNYELKMTMNPNEQTNLAQSELENDLATNMHNHHFQSINTTTSSQLTGASLQTTSGELSATGSALTTHNQHPLSQHSQHHNNNNKPLDPENPYPLYAPITFFYLNQTARPRSWCLAIVSNKYPNHHTHTHRLPFGGVTDSRKSR